MQNFEFIQSKTDNKIEILRIFKKVYNTVLNDLEYDWKYNANPAGHAISYFAYSNGLVVGVVSFFPWRIIIDGKEYLVFASGDGMVDPTYQRKGIIQGLYKKAFNDLEKMDIAGIMGFTNEKNTAPSLRAGWHSIGDLEVFVKILNWSSYLYNIKFKRFKSMFVMLSKLENILYDIDSSTIIASKIKIFDERIDELFSKFIHGEYTCGVIVKRYHEYLNWKYMHNPAANFKSLTFSTINNRLLGYIVWLENDLEIRIQDMFILPGYETACLKKIMFLFRASGFLTARGAFGAGTTYNKALTRCGFIRRYDQLKMIVKPIGRFQNDDLSVRTKWFFTLGDRDAAI